MPCPTHDIRIVNGDASVKLKLMVFTLCMALLPAKPQAVHLGVPPVGAQSRAGFTYLRPTANFRAGLRLDCTGKRVSIGWEYSAIADFTDAELIDDYANQVVPVGYWPTYVEVVDSATILVAGKQRNGNTKIERWIVATPVVAQLVGGGGYSIDVQPVSDIEVLYDEAVVGKDMVRTMFRVRGKPASALVQFYDSGDLYEMDWGTPPHALTAVLATTAEPALSQSYNAYDAGDHASLGYVYVWAENVNYFSTPALVLVDADRNGSIDARHSMTWQQYHAAGLDSASAYIELNGQ